MVAKTKGKPGIAHKNNTFTAAEISEIIRQCSAQGVTELKYGDLHLAFRPKIEMEMGEQNPSRHQTKPTEAAISDEQHDKQSKQSLEKDEMDLREQQIAELHITNPLLAEQLMVEGDLVDDDSDNDVEES